ncbi:hypothetical protein JOB18_047930 [Solea senegalensis]|uniref:Uncharacterized protein n=1 Tax=Solea senegalensis TaxID=28829 RepID=A0AAV6QY83_SOLSE|nr:hypothetical protein JOB18_047930 [Solea senegalensis]
MHLNAFLLLEERTSDKDTRRDCRLNCVSESEIQPRKVFIGNTLALHRDHSVPEPFQNTEYQPGVSDDARMLSHLSHALGCDAQHVSDVRKQNNAHDLVLSVPTDSQGLSRSTSSGRSEW